MVKTLVWKISDDDGDVSTTTVYLPDAASAVDVQEFAALQAPLIDDMIDGKIEGAAYTIDIDISGLIGNNALGQNDAEVIGAFQFSTSQGDPVKFNIPAIPDLLAGANSDALNQAAPQLSPLIAAMTNGLSTVGGNVAPCARNEDDIVALTFARENARSSGKRK